LKGEARAEADRPNLPVAVTSHLAKNPDGKTRAHCGSALRRTVQNPRHADLSSFQDAKARARALRDVGWNNHLISDDLLVATYDSSIGAQ
jgi:hypothetical protein